MKCKKCRKDIAKGKGRRVTSCVLCEKCSEGGTDRLLRDIFQDNLIEIEVKKAEKKTVH